MTYYFLLSGLFLGWSLGANDAANIFGTAVSARMLTFKTAAVASSIFVIIGAVWSGQGASHTIGALGNVSTLPAAFTAAFTAALAVFFMTKGKIPVSTSQAIVGSIIGWNLYTHTGIDTEGLTKISITWISSPLLAALTSFVLFHSTRVFLEKKRVHLLKIDSTNRFLLLGTAIFGAFSLGANNIANVIGVFIPSNPFPPIDLLGYSFSAEQVLSFIGALSISAGILSYSHKVIATVGKDLFHLSPITALIVVLSQSIVLFVFSSSELGELLRFFNLPPFPLVPVSSSQAIIGAVLGIGLAKRSTAIHYSLLLKIALGWILTPLLALVLSYSSLFFARNVFLLNIQ